MPKDMAKVLIEVYRRGRLRAGRSRAGGGFITTQWIPTAKAGQSAFR